MSSDEHDEILAAGACVMVAVSATIVRMARVQSKERRQQLMTQLETTIVGIFESLGVDESELREVAIEQINRVREQHRASMS